MARHSRPRRQFSRNQDGLIEWPCKECGRTRYFKRAPTRDLCHSCGLRKRYRSWPPVGLKPINDPQKLIAEYESGKTLQQLGDQYGLSAMTVRKKILAAGGRTRTRSESITRANREHGNVHKAHARVRELCATGEFQRRCSARLQGIPVEEWTAFVTPENQRLVASPEYRHWQRAVFIRDKHTCRLCGARQCRIAAHHIYPKAKYPGRALDTNNGITLCQLCHWATIGHEEDHADYLMSLLKPKRSVA